MTYLSFLVCFVIAPSVLFAWLLHRAGRADRLSRIRLRRHWTGTLVLALIALVWTTPWDNAIIAKGVWSYGSERVLATVGLVPLEEYAFMLFMPIFNAGIMGWFFLRANVAPSRWRTAQPKARRRVGIVYGVLWVLGLSGLAFEPAFYFSSILVWFIPPLVLQSLFDPSGLWRDWRLVAAGTLLPTLYFSLVDAFAIREGIWTIHDATRSGWEFGGLPLEEAFFFFTTSLLLAQGLVLWHGLFRDKER
jgi:lycopene cyclase domain-containing protein